MSIKFYTVATKSDGYFPILLESAKRNHIDLKVLGMGMRWLGFAWKWKVVYEEIKNLDGNEFIGVVDAYDVVFLKSADYIMNKIFELDIQDKLVVGEEEATYSYKRYFGGDCNKRAANAGAIIGKKKYVVAFIKSMCGEPVYNCRDSKDDQYSLVQYCYKYPSRVYVDHAQNIHLVHYMRFVEKVHDAISKNKGAILHAPGNTNIDEILKSYGYNFNSKKTRPKKSFFESKIMSHWFSHPHYQRMIVIEILIFIIVVSLFIISFKLFIDKYK